jgi:hypothetical protein
MMKKLIFAAGAGLGYVLGTRAGRERYEKMSAQARQLLDNPTVRDAKDAVSTEASRLYGEGRQRMQETLRRLGDRNGRHLHGDDELLDRPDDHLLDRTVSPETNPAFGVPEGGSSIQPADRLGG